MKIILTLLLSLFSVSILSQNIYQIHHSIVPGVSGKEIGETYYGQYFVDAKNGNDSYPGTNTDSAWQTISKISGNVSSGDTISFKCGETWRETLTVPDDSLTFMSYGSGDKPKILGSELALNFVNVTGNIWGATNDLDNPYDLPGDDMEIWFEELDDSISWGEHETWTADFTNLTEEHDWTWHGDTIYVYADSDPDSKYSAIECGQRYNIIELNGKEYIEVNGINMFYSVSGIKDEGSPTQGYDGFISRNSEIGYLGIKDGAGYGIHACYNDMLIEYDTIHDCGRRGISIINYGSTDISNTIIQYCEFYNGYHTTGIDIETGSTGGSTGNLDSIVVRNNLIWDYKDRSTTEGTAELMWVQGPHGGTGQILGIYIYNNIFKHISQSGISFEDVDGSYTYNNTFYGHNTEATGNTFHVAYGDGSTNAALKNNIFYTDLPSDNNYTGVCVYETGGQDHTEIDADYNLYYRIADDLRMIVATGNNYYRTVASFNAMKAATGWETNSPVPADPTFTSSTNFHLQTGSPAIDAGIAIDFITTDYEGVERGDPPCIGAFETIED